MISATRTQLPYWQCARVFLYTFPKMPVHQSDKKIVFYITLMNV